jgi:hypothetical protein
MGLGSEQGATLKRLANERVGRRVALLRFENAGEAGSPSIGWPRGPTHSGQGTPREGTRPTGKEPPPRHPDSCLFFPTGKSHLAGLKSWATITP